MNVSKLKPLSRNATFKSGILIFIIILTLVLLKTLYPTSSRLSFEERRPKYRIDWLVTRLSSSINDSLPHYQFKKKEDSIRSRVANENFMSGGSLGAFGFGTGEYKTKAGEQKYFLNVLGYFAKDVFDY